MGKGSRLRRKRQTLDPVPGNLESVKQPFKVNVTEVQTLRDDDFEQAKRLFSVIEDPTAAGAINQIPFSCRKAGGVLYFAERDGAPIAAAQLNLNYEEIQKATLAGLQRTARFMNQRYRMIELIAVDPDYRRQGIASILLAAVERSAARRGVMYLTAVVEEDAHSIHFFKERGYQVLEPGEPMRVSVAPDPAIAFAIIPRYRWLVKRIHQLGADKIS